MPEMMTARLVRTSKRLTIAWTIAMAMVCLVPMVGRAQPPSTAAAKPVPAEEDLAKKLSNPISDLVSVPFQFNWQQDVGPDEITRFILNVQPVMPFAISHDWNMIARVIAPFISQPPLSEGGLPAFGISDLTTSFFFSPSRPSRFTWGVGPVFLLPSATIPELGTGRWSVGPTAIALVQTGPWTFGTLWNQAWSFAGDSARPDVDQMFLQPFVAYNTATKWTYTIQSETTANWELDGDDRWSVPINMLAAKLSTFGTFPASYQFGGGVYAAHPDIGPTWQIRSAIVLLLPKRN